MAKPIVFNYNKYERLREENERLQEEIVNLRIRCRIAEEDAREAREGLEKCHENE